FQAEDGIRDGHVTGVQTCALPILFSPASRDALCAKFFTEAPPRQRRSVERYRDAENRVFAQAFGGLCVAPAIKAAEPQCPSLGRSEERRVGKECRRREGGKAGKLK